MEFDYQSFELEFGLIFAIIGLVFLLVVLYRPGAVRRANPVFTRLWEISAGCLATGAALIYAGVR